MLTEFQPYLRKRVTLFGAESVGKTTTTRRLEDRGLAIAQPEWARPYLELSAVGPEVTAEKMHTIWQGQLAQQQAAEAIAARRRRPFIAQDTDLFSTVGYWLLKGAEFGEPDVPTALWADAADNASDLYVILGQDAVPFAPDPLRYGGDRRESADEFWIDLCESAVLPWVLVDEPVDRIAALAEELHLDVLQLHGAETVEDVRALRSRTVASIWKSIRVRDAHDARESIAAWAEHADGLLLDGWSPHAAGGTGTAFEWEALRDVRAQIPAHVTLVVAGGLTADNVASAIRLLSPDIVDVSSGVETEPGIKSHERIRAFVAASREQKGAEGR